MPVNAENSHSHEAAVLDRLRAMHRPGESFDYTGNGTGGPISSSALMLLVGAFAGLTTRESIRTLLARTQGA